MCFEKELISPSQTGGLEIRFGDNEASLAAMLTLSDDIGTMADRIGEMADRILIMSDNIGLMADRTLAAVELLSDRFGGRLVSLAAAREEQSRGDGADLQGDR